jgi:O-antigen ligase
MTSFSKHDRVFLLLFSNAILVILGYALAIATGFASILPMKILKTLLLLGSIIYVMSQTNVFSSLKAVKNKKLIIALCLSVPYFAFLSNDVWASLNRTLTFLIPLVYVWVSLSLLIHRYGQKEVLQILSGMISIIYSIPMLAYVVFGGGFSGQSIYGESVGQVFISNHFGWSAALFLISNFHATINKMGGRTFLRLSNVLLILLAVYLLIVSGNRSSWLAVVLCLIVFLFYYQGVPLYQKFLILISPVILFSYLLSQKNEAIFFVIERTERKSASGDEGRLERLDVIIERLSETPAHWFTGVGLFNYTAFTKEGKGIANYHNSYFEILFGLGLPLFVLFMVFMLYEPIRQFMTRVSKYDLLLIPLVIIPFFESNLTAGQFLFFPWFSYVFALNAKKKYAFYGTRNWFRYITPKRFVTKAKEDMRAA